MPHEHDWPFESWLFPSLLTCGSVMFRHSVSPILLWPNPCQKLSALYRYIGLTTVWYCAMVLHQHCGSVSDSCRYVAITQADNSIGVFLLKLKSDKIILRAAVAQSRVLGWKAEEFWSKSLLKVGWWQERGKYTFRVLPRYPWARYQTPKRSNRALLWAGDSSIAIPCLRLSALRIGSSTLPITPQGKKWSRKKLLSVKLQIIFLPEWFIASLQVIYFTLHKRFVKNKIHQFVDLCSISNVSRKVFYCHTTTSAFHCFANVNVNFSIDFSAAVLSPVLWILHPWTFCTRTCRYKHGGIKQQSEKRSCT